MLELALCCTSQWMWARASLFFLQPFRISLRPSLCLRYWWNEVDYCSSRLFKRSFVCKRNFTVSCFPSHVIISLLTQQGSHLKFNIELRFYSSLWKPANTFVLNLILHPFCEPKHLSQHPINSLNECITHVVSQPHPSHCHGIKQKTEWL